MKKNQNNKIKEKEETKQKPSKTDPLGSYTGVPKDPMDTPTQDADDL